MAEALASPRTRDKRGHGLGRRERPHTHNAQSKEEMECREQKPKGLCIIRAARVKQTPECAAESDKRGGNGKSVKARKVMGSNGSGACT